MVAGTLASTDPSSPVTALPNSSAAPGVGPAARSNTLFAYAPADGPFSNPFPNTKRFTLPAAEGERIGLEVVGGGAAKVHARRDERTGCCAYLWGLAGRAGIGGAELVGWCLEVIESGDFTPLRELVGLFVLVIDDRRNNRVRFVSDHMGLRPWFVGRFQGRLVAGSDVWAIQDAGLNAGSVNYDAVASWLRYNFNCTGGSLFTDFAQSDPCSVATWENGALSQAQYATFTGGQAKPPIAQVAAGLHERISSAFDAVAGELSHVSVALSGGFDSRYLAAMAVQRKHLQVEAFNIRDREAEGTAASMVAQELALKLNVIQTDGSLWNIFPEPYHFTADGFPMTKQLSHVAAMQRPGVPCLNGFFGDPIVRGTMERAQGKLEREISGEDPAAVLSRHHHLKPWQGRIDLIDPAIVDRADQRLIAVWRKHLARWQHTGHPFFCANLFVRQRHYFSNNFLQHMDVAEAIVPFTACEVIAFKLAHDSSCFGWETYEAMFDTFFPRIAHVPHNSKMGGARNELLDIHASRCSPAWAAAVLAALRKSDRISIVSRRKSIPRLLGAMMGRYDVEIVATFLYRLLLLDDRLRRSGVAFDWRAI